MFRFFEANNAFIKGMRGEEPPRFVNAHHSYEQFSKIPFKWIKKIELIN